MIVVKKMLSIVVESIYSMIYRVFFSAHWDLYMLLNQKHGAVQVSRGRSKYITAYCINKQVYFLETCLLA